MVIRLILTILCLSAVVVWAAWVPLPVADDPLVRMPGTQPDQGVVLAGPGQCDSCHTGFDAATEPGGNWKGSMMAQAARDFLFWSCVTVALQDSIWAIGDPNAADLCMRCHFPGGWLGGRSDPPNGSRMTGIDFDGVQCNSCHYMYDPFFETTHDGTREGNDWLNYWDETNASGTPSNTAALNTYNQDLALSSGITLFNGDPFYTSSHEPLSPDYTENASGQYFVSTLTDNRRASFADANPSHAASYSRYHKSKFFCAACHDVSNPVLHNLGADPTQPLPTELDSAHSYFHVERTFSEFMLSDYGQQGGAPGVGPYAPNVFETSLANNNIARCQDCHMPDVAGRAAKQNKAVVRPDESTEHPNSGVPVHDMTGGNAWVSAVLASAITGSPNYDAVNAGLLNQGPSVLTLDLTQGESLDAAALVAGSARAQQQLLKAAAIENLDFDGSHVSFRIVNQTGHKLISGFPEGRRMFVNIQAYNGGQLVYEVNPYDAAAGTLKGLSFPYDDPDGVLPSPAAIGAAEHHEEELIYEMKPASSLTGEEKTFHFVLADGRHKDNRIPPRGFRIADAPDRLCVPVEDGVEDPDYFSAAEYAGGYDEVIEEIPVTADFITVTLYYQTTSREYIEFLRNEINGSGALTLTGTGAGGDPPYIAQTDPFFDQLRAWGDTLWALWKHNMDLPGAAPVLMASDSVGTVPSADLSLSKTGAPLTAYPGETIIYALTVTNNGPAPASGVEVIDTLPAGSTFLTASPGCVNVAGTVTCTIGALANGAEALLSILASADSTGSLLNSATVSSTSNDPNSGNDSAQFSVTVSPAADLLVTKTDSTDPVLSGMQLTYTVTVTNQGPSMASGVQLSDTLPAGVSLVSTNPTSPTCSATGSIITCDQGSLNSGQSSPVTITVAVGASVSGGLTNTVTVSATEFDPDESNNSATEITTAVRQADMEITKSDSVDPVVAGNHLTYTLTVTNHGPSLASAIQLTDTLPAGVGLVSVTPAAPACTETSGTVSCNWTDLAPGASANVTLVVDVLSETTGQLSNTAAVSAVETDPNAANDSATELTIVSAQADLQISKSDAIDPIQLGEDVNYTVSIVNSGPSDAAGVAVVDTLPAGVTFVSASAGCSESVGTVTCTVGELTEGDSRDLSIVVTPTDTGTISNSATVSATTTDPDETNNAASESTTVNEVVSFSFDIDGNGLTDALTDGLLDLRYLFGFRGDALTLGALAPDATRNTAEVEAYLGGNLAYLDADGNALPDALTDGLLALRYFFGFRGDSLITGAVGVGCTRCTAAEIEAYLGLYD